MANQIDSLGNLPSLAKSSGGSMPMPALNVKLLGSDFAQSVDSEVMAKQLYRLAAVFGDPWGKDQRMLQQMAGEWLGALSDLPAAAVDRGISEWIKSGDRWPKPADIRKRAEDQVHERVAKVSEERQIHPSRLKPTDDMKHFLYQSSPLRRNPNWDRFLDTVHPTVEHNYFANAKIGRYEHIIEIDTGFGLGWLIQNLGDKMAKHFGQRVILKLAGEA